MRNVMKKAWEIAKEGQKKFGGKVKEDFAQALKMAWAIAKKGMDYVKRVKGTIDLEKAKITEMKGTPKQIKWAEDIRNRALRALLNEVTTEEYESINKVPGKKNEIITRPVKGLFNSMRSLEGIEKHLDETPENQIESTVKSMNSMYDRFERFAEIASNDEAKFWIDKRDNQTENHMFKAFKKYVSKGIKEF